MFSVFPWVVEDRLNLENVKSIVSVHMIIFILFYIHIYRRHKNTCIWPKIFSIVIFSKHWPRANFIAEPCVYDMFFWSMCNFVKNKNITMDKCFCSKRKNRGWRGPWIDVNNIRATQHTSYSSLLRVGGSGAVWRVYSVYKYEQLWETKVFVKSQTKFLPFIIFPLFPKKHSQTFIFLLHSKRDSEWMCGQREILMKEKMTSCSVCRLSLSD